MNRYYCRYLKLVFYIVLSCFHLSVFANPTLDDEKSNETVSKGTVSKEPVSKEKAVNARELMKAVFDREDGDTQFSRQTLTSCRYAIENRRVNCNEAPRVKVLESVRKDYGENGKDRKSISILLDPAVERGISFLQYDYDAKGQDTDQWMYLSALGKVKRIVSGDENQPKTGTFFGSEFSYEDLEQRHLDDYNYNLVKRVTYQGRPCAIIEAFPEPSFAKRSHYSKSVHWVDVERHLILKSLLFNRQGKREKRISVDDVTLINHIWTALKITVNNHLTERMSQLELRDVVYNQPVNDDFLTLRSLTDAAFRQTHLNRLSQPIDSTDKSVDEK